jgi:GPH family glycoside/pentoside/hexuronide:cation symporter
MKKQGNNIQTGDISKQQVLPKSLSKRLKVAYALGQYGWSLIIGLINIWLVWFYNPPAGEAGALSVHLIPQNRFWGFLTVIGLITMAGRLLDAVTDPLIATMSDRSEHKKGRRISFMQKGAIPFAVVTALVFFAPTQYVSTLNVVWLTVTLLLSFVFYTVYVTPYFALVSEFGHTSKEKLDLATYISATWFLGYATASFASSVWGIFEGMGMEKLWAIRLTMVIFAGIGLLFMMIPVMLIDEKTYSSSKPSAETVKEAFKATLSNKNFRIFAFSDLFYWFAVTVFQTGTVYYITVLIGLDDSWTGIVVPAIGVLSFLFYPIVNLTAKRIGKKKMLIGAFVAYSVVFLYSSLLGTYDLASEPQVYIFILMTGLPMAILGILPNAMIADVADYDEKRTGVARQAMFFGTRTFMSKMGQMLAMLVFGWIITYGNSAEHPIGIRMTAVIAAVACLVGMVVLLFYNEKEVLKGIESDD